MLLGAVSFKTARGFREAVRVLLRGGLALMGSQFIHPVDRLREYLRAIRMVLGQTRDHVQATGVELAAHLTQLEALATSQLAQLERLAAGAEAGNSSRRAEHAQLVEIMRLIHGRNHERRLQLRELRASDAYERAYSDPDPLVSVVIPTYDNHQLLRERAIPSVLAQTHRNFEIVVVGDASPDEARAAAEFFDDPRIAFFNRLYRGPYPAEPDKRWLVAGVPPYNEAVHRARGLWIAPLDDDDAFRPHHIELLLTRARKERLELCYGQLRSHFPDGTENTIGRFPPELSAFGVQSALYQTGLARIFELELADAAFGLPYDWAMCLRMMEADVRIGMVEEETVDYFPSRLWTPRWQENQLGPIAPENPPEADQAPPEWEYVPDGFAHTRVAGGQAAIGWGAEEVARAYREKWPRFLEALKGPGPLGVYHEVPAGGPIGRHDVVAQNSVLAFAFALAHATNGSEPLSVLDRGGALGHYNVIARRLFPELELDYHCRELPAVCAQGREVSPEVTFHDTDDCFDRSYDLVMASSSLQYAEDWRELVRRLAAASARWTFFTRVPLVRQHPSFVVLQRAHAYGYATEYLGWVFNRDELLSAAADAGLELDRELVITGEVPIQGAPEAFTHGAFLFRVNRLR
jgi:putative methyltransferase (TIGR04325 family)